MGCLSSKPVSPDPPLPTPPTAERGATAQGSASPPPVVKAPRQPDPLAPSALPRSPSPIELKPTHHREMPSHAPALRNVLSTPQEPHSSLPPIARSQSTDAFGRGNRSNFTPWAPELSNVKKGRASTMNSLPSQSQSQLTSTLRHVLAGQLKFRILVVGKKNSGKSSLINTIFKVDMHAAQGSSARKPNINLGISPEDNRYLIIHECSGFEPGDAPGLQSIRDFISSRTDPNLSAPEKLHVIWICIPISDANSRNIGEGVEEILALRKVPVVVVFTGFDLIVSAEGGSHERARRTKAQTQYHEFCRSLIRREIPIAIVSVDPQYRDLINNLVMRTDGVITGSHATSSASARSSAPGAKSRIAPVPLVWSVALRVSQHISIQASIEVGRKEYWRDLRSSKVFADRRLKTCVNIIHMDIVEIWNLNDKSKYLSSAKFRAEMSHIVKDLDDSAGGVSSSADPRGSGENFAEWVQKPYHDSQENVRCVMGYIVDLTVILDGIFRAAPGKVSDDDALSALSVVDEHVRSGCRDTIHEDIRSFVKETFEIRSSVPRDLVLEKIIDLIKQHCVPFDNA